MYHLMIDIETLELLPTAYVTQVGFCVFDEETGAFLHNPKNFYIDDSQPGDVGIDTISWWMHQSDGARKAVFPQHVIKISPGEMFDIFEDIVKDCSPCVWGSPAMFDLPILTHMWGGKKPWVYNMERDMMTLYKLVDPKGILKPAANALAHDAASDADWQARYLINLLQALKTLQARVA